MNKLIEKISSLTKDQNVVVTKGISGLDISKPIALHHTLFRKGNHGYGGCDDTPFELGHNIPSVHWYAHKEDCTAVGILLFELLFSQQSYVTIHITQAQSEINTLYLYLERASENEIYGLEFEQKEAYKSYDYTPQKGHKDNNYKDELMPLFSYSHSGKNHISINEKAKKSDQLVVSVSVVGLIYLAELFLNMSNQNNTQTELSLENPLLGIGGVHPLSLEAQFWLPYSVAFYGKSNVNELIFN
ncbi:hypothetical protein [Vibrio sp. MA40-2]|uniref:hypothetical protein n=1 Tax=Vibrio sp. MA40-2 TaxID=3391828 RepID=UPI0039A690FD